MSDKKDIKHINDDDVEVITNKNEEESSIKDAKVKKRQIDLTQVVQDGENDGEGPSYTFVEKKPLFFDGRTIRKNFEELNMNSLLFTSGVSIASGLFPILVDKLKNKKGVRDITQEDLVKIVFSTLPSIFNTAAKLTDGTMSSKAFTKISILAQWATIHPAIQAIIQNIKDSGPADKIDFSDSEIWIQSIPFIVNKFILPTIGNPSIIKRSISLGKILVGNTFGKKIEDYVNNKVFKGTNIKIKGEDVFDLASGGLDALTDELQKRGVIESKDRDNIQDAFADRVLSLASNTLIPKVYNKNKNHLGSASVRRRDSFV